MNFFRPRPESAPEAATEGQLNPGQPEMVAAAEPDELAALEAERGVAQAELDRISRAYTALDNAESVVATIDAELAKLDRSEREAWATWAQKAEGPAPTPRTDEREGLARRRALAVAGSTGAAVAKAALIERQVPLLSRLRELSESLMIFRSRQLIAKASEDNEVAHRLVAELLANDEAFSALHIALERLQGEAARGGNAARVRKLTLLLEEMDAIKRPDEPRHVREALERHVGQTMAYLIS